MQSATRELYSGDVTFAFGNHPSCPRMNHTAVKRRFLEFSPDKQFVNDNRCKVKNETEILYDYVVNVIISTRHTHACDVLFCTRVTDD